MRIVLTFISLATLFFFFSCTKRKDDTLDKAILNYALLCPGGSSACTQSCEAQYPTVTTANFQAVSTCTSNCTTNCSVQTIFLLIQAQK
jgi:hypothetical protein